MKTTREHRDTRKIAEHPKNEDCREATAVQNGAIKTLEFVDADGVDGMITFPRQLDIEGYDGIDQLLPYDGERNVVHRSAWAKTGFLVGRTEEDGGRPRVIGHESALERYVALNALLHPNTFGLKCQPRTVVFADPVGDVKSNTLDFLVTLKCGQQTYLYVKNEDNLSRPRHALICQQVRMALPAGVGFAAVSEVCFPAWRRGNLERLFLAKRFTDPEADARLVAVLNDNIDTPAFTVEELVFRCGLGPRTFDQGRAFDAVLRCVADRRLEQKHKGMIDYPTVMERAA
ncbi:hypothetical protein [Tropicibacter naphthalenivorans]|uniref:TnsA endonuclease N-terminal domain-containing protein n=1 Tax=Tropicibacter naphthalenivorans TaxID=441103 RepID=A0A0N7M199_9RHOB|nr:hypothetical protein [Tropicibacter naphthalenivorans]CUH82673.1 hypothetical protein TRN7648_04216 [Tropicibacter naphthalenivorans]SMD11439.1 hypothetical protein SAMN04488093_12611 [Tropicibacter naphthalenivorans]